MDKQVTDIMLKCDKICNPFQYGPYSLSSKLTQIGMQVRYWNLQVLHAKKDKIPFEVRENSRIKAKISAEYPATILELEELKKTICLELKKMHDKAKDNCYLE